MTDMDRALMTIWRDFLEANPDDLTSPEDLPDHALVTFDQFAGMVAVFAAERTGAGQVYTGSPPPHWPSYQRPGKIWERHPQTADEWDYRNDPTGQRQNRCEARLAFAGDLADPRAPDQMAVVHRLDVSMLIGELTHRRAQAESFRARLAALPSLSDVGIMETRMLAVKRYLASAEAALDGLDDDNAEKAWDDVTAALRVMETDSLSVYQEAVKAMERLTEQSAPENKA